MNLHGDTPRVVKYLPGVAAGLSGMIPGRYVPTEKWKDCAWSEFTLDERGHVVFIDSGDRHLSYNGCHPGWARHMLQAIEEGLLARVVR